MRRGPSPDTGSSPLTRGKQAGPRNCNGSRGLIPAHAGKTAVCMASMRREPAHPRSRGENVTVSEGWEKLEGSSPLTRGKRRAGELELQTAGLIPAHAGKTVTSPDAQLIVGAHPRSRGENEARGAAWHPSEGSSPLTRGKLLNGDLGRVALGLIPAHAGKTPGHRARHREGRAHPRSRGENYLAACLDCGVKGSSPLTRGKQSNERRPNRWFGLIPAHAGKTCPRNRHRSSPRAHPRSRGENSTSSGFPGTIWGSSPLTRGKLLCVVCALLHIGLIPAHAGKTPASQRSRGFRWAHPRSRGENTQEQAPASDHAGSSPLTRGKPNRLSLTCTKTRAHPRSRGENS